MFGNRNSSRRDAHRLYRLFSGSIVILWLRVCSRRAERRRRRIQLDGDSWTLMSRPSTDVFRSGYWYELDGLFQESPEHEEHHYCHDACTDQDGRRYAGSGPVVAIF